MQILKRGMALLLVFCIVMGMVLTNGTMVTKADTFDPYVYVFGPDESTIPNYYRHYAKAYVGWSPHEVGYYDIVRMFNIVNVEELVENEADAPAGGYATVSTFCVDRGTPTRSEARYRRLNLEDAYFCREDGIDYTPAKNIRAILRCAIPYLENPEVIQEKANAYLTATYDDEAEMVEELTSTELLSAVQSAVWHNSNSSTFNYPSPYCGTANFEDPAYGDDYTKYFPQFMSEEDPFNVREKQSAYTDTNIQGVQRYLLSLPGEESEDIVITDGALSVEKVVMGGSGDDCTLILMVGINGTIDGDDDLVLSAKCGDKTQTYRLGETNTLNKNEDDLYPVTFTGVSEADCSAVELELNGDQTVNDIAFFEAEPTKDYSARRASQGFAGYSAGSAPVQDKKTVNPLADTTVLEITKVDEKTGNALCGVFFDLYMKQEGGDRKVGSFTTDENGKITVAVTDDGAEYYFVETEALDGYEVLKDSVTGGQVTNTWNSGSLEITKILNDTISVAGGKTFTFNVTLDLSTAPVANNGLSWMTDDYFKGLLTSSKTITWSVAEKQKLTATITLGASETVTIDGIPEGTVYTVEEKLTADDQKLYNVTVEANGTVQNDIIASGSIDGKNTVVFTNTVVTDTVKYGELSVNKQLINTTDAVPGAVFKFKITIDLPTETVENTIPWIDDNYLLGKITCDKDLDWKAENGKYTAEFEVKKNDTVTIRGLAYGTIYTVEEQETEEYRNWYTVTTQIGEGAPVAGSSVSGTIAENNALIFTNSVVTDTVNYGELSVNKQLINTTDAVPGAVFKFKITIDLPTETVKNTIPWIDDNYLLGMITCDKDLNWKAENGKYTAEFEVKKNDTVTIRGLAYGTIYTVEEQETEEYRDWYIVTTQIGEGAPVAGSSVSGTIAEKNALIFTNTVVTDTVNYGELSVNKQLINTTDAVPGEVFKFKITIDLPTETVKNTIPWIDDNYLLGKITCDKDLAWKAENGKYTAEFEVKKNDTVTIRGLAYGTIYTVEELETEEYRNWYIVTTQIGEGAPVAGSSVSGTIAENNALIFTNSVVTDTVNYGELSVNKQLINTTDAVPGEVFKFKITIDLPTETVKNTIPWIDDNYLLGKITCDKDLDWKAENGKYTAEFEVKKNDTVTIRGLAYGTIYTVEELETEEYRNWYIVTTQIGEGAPVAGSSVSGTIAENNALIFTNSVVTDTVKYGELSVNKQLINTTDAVPGAVFKFKITIDLPAETVKNAIPWIDDNYLLGKITCDKDLVWKAENGKYTAEFEVEKNDTVTIRGLAYGTIYTVEEQETEEYRNWYIVTTQIGEGAPVAGSSVSGTIAENNALIFTNSVVTDTVKYGELSVNKQLINTTDAVPGEVFKFKITIDLPTETVKNAIPWIDDNYLLGKITCDKDLAWKAENGKYTAEFEVEKNDTVTIRGLAYGTIYTVEELEAEEYRNWYIVTTQIGEGEPVAGSSVSGTIAENNALIFTNSVVIGPELKLGDLEVSKKLINTTPAKVGETFNFRITIDLSTADIYVNAAPWMNDEYLMSFITGTEELVWTAEDGKYTADFTVNADETFAISGIAYGTSYAVEEILTEEEREWFTVTTQIGEEDAVDGTAVESTVAEKNAVLFTNSVVAGPELKLGKLEVSKKLVNAAPAQVGEYFNFSIVVDFSTADVYVDAAPWMNDEYLIGQVKGSKELIWIKSGNNTYTATFTLKADEAITIEGIAVGASYTLQEELSEDDRKVYRVTNQITTDGVATGENKSYEARGSIAAENAVQFTNQYVPMAVPETSDFGIGMQLLCLMAVLTAVILLLNRRRLI